MLRKREFLRILNIATHAIQNRERAQSITLRYTVRHWRVVCGILVWQCRFELPPLRVVETTLSQWMRHWPH